ncbi:MAG: hypothetical protein GX552_04055 [Chloroflexi bacterium]|nr:hypothetical protein [Chloroflexota bacterium]
MLLRTCSASIAVLLAGHAQATNESATNRWAPSLAPTRRPVARPVDDVQPGLYAMPM